MQAVLAFVSEGLYLHINIFPNISINCTKLHFKSWRKNFSNDLAVSVK